MKRTIFLSLLLLAVGIHPLSARVISNMYTSGNKIQEMIYTGDSIICATAGGVVWWDTRTMTYKKHTFADGLPGNDIYSIAQGPDGKLWCGTDAGIASYDGKSWTIHRNLPVDPRSPISIVSDIAVTPNGIVWAAAFSSSVYGVLRLKDGEWTWMSIQDGLPEGIISKIAWGSYGSMAFGSNGYGLAVINGSRANCKSLYDITIL